MKLPLSIPTITSHHYYALPLAVIGSDEKLKPWIYNQFIQIYTIKSDSDGKIDLRLYKGKRDMFDYAPLWRTITDGKQFI